MVQRNKKKDFVSTEEINILLAIDAPDPDNFVAIIAAMKLYPKARFHILLSGRPVCFDATKEHQTWQWDMESSRMTHTLLRVL